MAHKSEEPPKEGPPAGRQAAQNETIAFTDKGAVQVPEKEDIIEGGVRAGISRKLLKERVEGELRAEEGQDVGGATKKGGMTKDTPQVIFRLIGKVIQCPKFELDDQDATLMATNLNILLPLDGKIAALVIVIMITVNKVVICFDAIARLFAKKPPADLPTLQDKDKKEPPLQEQIK
jgi:hypothetical protein